MGMALMLRANGVVLDHNAGAAKPHWHGRAEDCLEPARCFALLNGIVERGLKGGRKEERPATAAGRLLLGKSWCFHETPGGRSRGIVVSFTCGRVGGLGSRGERGERGDLRAGCNYFSAAAAGRWFRRRADFSV